MLRQSLTQRITIPSFTFQTMHANRIEYLAAAFDCWKDNHESSDDKVNNDDDELDTDTVAAAKVASDALKAEVRLQSFVDTLMKLDQKLIEDRNACKHDAEEAVRSLKCSSSC